MNAPKEIGTSKTVTLCGETFERIPCGSRYDEVDDPPEGCGDCCVSKGEIHEVGCDMELCPRCGDQFAFCECHAENKTWIEKQKVPKKPSKGTTPDPDQATFGF